MYKSEVNISTSMHWLNEYNPHSHPQRQLRAPSHLVMGIITCVTTCVTTFVTCPIMRSKRKFNDDFIWVFLWRRRGSLRTLDTGKRPQHLHLGCGSPWPVLHIQWLSIKGGEIAGSCPPRCVAIELSVVSSRIRHMMSIVSSRLACS